MDISGDCWAEAHYQFHPYICKSEATTVKGNSNITIRYTKENLTSIQSLHVWYTYKRASQDLLDSWEDKRMTGMQLSWKIESPPKLMTTSDIGGSIQGPRYQDQFLVRMVQMASRARANNMTREEILEKTVENKAKLITSEFIQYTSMCSRGQVMIGFYPKVFDEMKITVNGKKNITAVTDEDIETGYMLFSAIVYCSESVALSQFLHNLLSTQSPRTIIQATVNTIQSGNLKEVFNRDRINQFYIALDKIFHFQLVNSVMLPKRKPKTKA